MTSDGPAIQPSPLWYPPRPPPGPSAARRLLHLGVLGFSLFLLVRTVLVEPFGVPTGSMAPTLLGVRRSATCSRCDHQLVVGDPGPDARPLAWDRCRCPNCGLPMDLSAARTLPGDRLLVDKLAFRDRPPRRWEVAVFDCPADRSKPYVKRLVGLPGEVVQVSGGDVYADGVLVRKTLRQARELLVSVFDQAEAPPGGWGLRWLLDNASLRSDDIVLDGREAPASATYRHWNLDADREEPVDGWLAYNGGPVDRRGGFGRLARGDAAHDFVAAFDLEVLAGDGLVGVTLDDGGDRVTAELPATAGPAAVVLRHDGRGQSHAHPGLRVGRSVAVEVALVDRRLSVCVGGAEVPPLDLPADRPGSARRTPVSRPVTLSARGVGAVVRNFRLLRDVHYLPFGVAASGWRLGPAEYFALGDNTANSHDSRTWLVGGVPAPGVPAGGLLGKPFLVHQPVRLGRLAAAGERAVQTVDWGRLRVLR